MTTGPSREVGSMVVTAWYDHAGDVQRFRVDQADPYIEVADEVLADLQERGWYGEGLFMVEATNGTFRYRLDAHDDERKVWSATRVDKGSR